MTVQSLPLVVTILTLALAGAAQSSNAAQRQNPPAGEGRSARPPGQLTPGDVGVMLDNYAAVRAQEALTLDDAHYAEFVTRLRALQQIRRRNQQAHNRVVQDLRKLAGAQAAPPYDEAAIRERLKALREQDDRAAVELRQAYDALDEVLDVRQQARFRLFEEMIERRKLDLLMRAQNAAARKGTIQP
jgi:Spy/CpxP family protein refolding chaperone